MRLRNVRYQYLVAIAFVFGTFMDILDTTITNVAIPQLRAHFGVGRTTIEWVVTGYLCSLAVWIPAAGWIGDRFGTKKTFLLFALAMFAGASALCGASWSAGSLIAFRVQGLGGGMLTPAGTAMLFRAFPLRERAQASSILAIPTVLAPALGGLIVTHTSWRWIFSVNVPIGIAGFVFAALYLEEYTEPRAGGFDVWGFVLSGSGLALVLYALATAPNKGWLSGVVLLTGIGGLLAFVTLVIVELRIPYPMLYLRLFGNRLFRTTNIASLMSSGSLLGLIFLLPLFLQELRGLSALQSGLTTFPQALGVMIMARVVGKIYPRIGPRPLLVFGLSMTTLVTSCFVFIDLGTSLWYIRLLMFGRGLAMAFAFIPLQAATFASVPPEDTGRASSIFSTQRQIGAALGVAILATVLTSRTGSLVRKAIPNGDVDVLNARVTAFHQALFAAAVLAALGIIASLFVLDSDAAASMRLERSKQTRSDRQ
ncbi:MAG: DHA2 family efflux MFS transporter permease subunit [Acidimicrobiales bacterium]